MPCPVPTGKFFCTLASPKKKGDNVEVKTLAVLSSLMLSCTLFFAVETSHAEIQRMDRLMCKKVDRLFREAQHRRGPALDARLTEIWQAVLPIEPEIEKYAQDNKRRHGAVIYVRASGEPGEKTIRMFFYSSSGVQMDGRLYKGINDWFLPNPIAQSVAKNVVQRLSSDPEVSYSATAECNELKVEVILSPKGGRAMKNPLVGESLTQK